jgi:glycosyltransferase involved in cell wall biosynthesis
MKIRHVSYSSVGGAGNSARLLSVHQSLLGEESELSTLSDSSVLKDPLADTFLTLRVAVDNLLIRNQKFKSPISLARDSHHRNAQPIKNDSDVMHFHWMNGVFPSIDYDPLTDKSILVWTLHDMNPFVGACHYSTGCSNFHLSCQECPAVKGVFSNLVKKNLGLKINRLIDMRRIFESLTFVAPSQWIAREASSSAALRYSRIEVLPQPIDEFFFKVKSGGHERKCNEPQRGLKLGIVAANLSDPLKGVEEFLRVFKHSKSGLDTLTLFGSNGHRFESRVDGVISVGETESQSLASKISGLDALIVFSQFDNAPLVVAESLAVGTPVIVRNVGGLPEMIANGVTGWVVKDDRDLAAAMSAIRKLDVEAGDRMSQDCRQAAFEKFHPELVAKRHLSLYASLLT